MDLDYSLCTHALQSRLLTILDNREEITDFNLFIKVQMI